VDREVERLDELQVSELSEWFGRSA
jgi:hypothetical protein